MTKTLEDYSRSRSLREFECAGERFRVVRRRFEGKHWRKYCIILHGVIPITDGFMQSAAWDDESNPDHWQGWFTASVQDKAIGVDKMKSLLAEWYRDYGVVFESIPANDS